MVEVVAGKIEEPQKVNPSLEVDNELKEEVDKSNDKLSPKDPLDNPDHPRFKEIYGKFKGVERALSEKDESIRLLKEHNELLQKSIDGVVDKDLEEMRPDPVAEPKEFSDWAVRMAKREIEKSTKVDSVKKNSGKDTSHSQQLLDTQITVMQITNEDYDELVEGIKADIEQDDVLRNKIWSSKNPPFEAYRYAKAKKDGKAGTRKENLDRGSVEGGGSPPPSDDGVKGLTAEQLNIAKKLGIEPKKYAIQLQQINKSKGGK